MGTCAHSTWAGCFGPDTANSTTMTRSRLCLREVDLPNAMLAALGRLFLMVAVTVAISSCRPTAGVAYSGRFYLSSGGGRGIRTPGTLSGTAVFKMYP